MALFFNKASVGKIDKPTTLVDQHGRMLVWFFPDILCLCRTVSFSPDFVGYLGYTHALQAKFNTTVRNLKPVLVDFSTKCHDCDIPPHPVHPKSRLHAALFALNSPHPNPIHIWTLSPPVLAFACTLQHLRRLCKRARRAAIPLRLARTSLTNREHSQPKCKSWNSLQSSRKQVQLLELASTLARYLHSL